ncbi:MAG: hypothetical protein K8F36_08575 [Melioribacteraceae bacterium]|nr:hypothetical protein [Melioribacteraceae bacterium]MDD3558565.1 hypothetical protein [Melioribacteraceae bacterium]
MRKYLNLIITMFIIFATASSILGGGVVKITETDSDGISITSQLFVQDGMLKIVSDQTDENTIMIFDSKNQIMKIADLNKKSYMEITKDDIKKFSQQMSGISKQMEEALKNVPPEQREMMEKMMKDKMPGMQEQEMPSKPEYKKVASGIQIGNWTTDKYEGYKNGSKIESVWIAAWQATSLKDEYMDVFKGMMSMFEEFAKSMGPMAASMEQSFDAELFEHGFPIKTEEYEDGKLVSTSLVEEMMEQNLSSDVFTLPAGLTKETPFANLEN